jgi:hypothetical protein
LGCGAAVASLMLVEPSGCTLDSSGQPQHRTESSEGKQMEGRWRGKYEKAHGVGCKLHHKHHTKLGHGIKELGLPCLQSSCSSQRSCAPNFYWRLSEYVSTVPLSGPWRLAPAAKLSRSVDVLSLFAMSIGPILPCLHMSGRGSVHETEWELHACLSSSA